MLNETALTGTGIILGEGQMAFYLHVDDGLVIGNDPDPIADVTSALHTAADALEDIGFTVTDRRVKQQVDKVIGYVPLASPALVKPPASKLALLHLSLGELLAQDSIYVPLLKSIIGSWLWCMLLNRNLLSIGHSLFQFLDRNAERTVKWWPSARLEVQVIRHTLLLCILDVGAALPTSAFATDAMGSSDADHGGFAVVGARISPDMAADLWRAGNQPLKTVVRLNGDVSNLLKPVSKLEARVPVSRLPPSLLNPLITEWQLFTKGRWATSDSIELGEGRATIQLLELLSISPGSFRYKIFAHEDNSSWGGAACKGRSPAPSLNHLCRRKAAFCLAKRWVLMLPWVQSAAQPADEASRDIP